MAEGDVGTGSNISNALKRKLGPLPGYAWIGLGVGGFLVYHKLKTGSFIGSGATSAAGPAVPADTSGQLDTGGGVGGVGGAGDAGGGSGSFGTPASSGAGFFFDPTPIEDLTSAIDGLLAAQTQPQTLAQPNASSTGLTIAPAASPTVAQPASQTSFAPGTIGASIVAAGAQPGQPVIVPTANGHAAIDVADIPSNLLNKPSVPLPVPVVVSNAGGGESHVVGGPSGAQAVKQKVTTTNYQAKRQL